ncbi:MAG: hypothetical protein PHD76_07200 [Methylacidiphilales bacterium]|nr:hypothetical protein [Candidatus Methylacidiphilales bacterium]
MKSNPTNRMKNAFFAGLMFHIEQMICAADTLAQTSGCELTDSQVRSTIIKARKLVQGAQPNLPEATERDRILTGLARSIYLAPDDIMEQSNDADGSLIESPLEISDWLKAIETVQHSIDTHRSDIPGSRNYLSFLQKFIAETQGEP